MISRAEVQFGAYPPLIKTETNLDEDGLQTALDLTRVKNAHARRIQDIDDSKDRLVIEFNVGHQETAAHIQTAHNGVRTLVKQAAQSAADFFLDVLSAAEAKARLLLSKEEKQALEVQAARDFLAPVTGAVLSGNYRISPPVPQNYGPQYKGTLSGATWELRIGDQTYQLSKHKRYNKVDYGISAQPHDVHRYYQFVNFYRDGKTDGRSGEPYFYYRLRDFAKEQDVSISTEDPDYRAGLQPLMADVRRIVAHLEAAGELEIPGSH